MTDQDLDALYKANIGTSHYAAIRGVFNAGVNYDKGLTQAPAQPAAAAVAAPAAVVLADTPAINTP
ncbi:MAG: hypothetical protein NVSMB70_01100 [Chamaesiphon sp.]